MKLLTRVFEFISSHITVASILLAIIVVLSDFWIYKKELVDSKQYRKDSFLRLIEQKARDRFYRFRGSLPRPQEIAVVTVDERSVQEVGRFPWPRRKLAQLVDIISEQVPRVIAFDILFTEKEAVNEIAQLDGILNKLTQNKSSENLSAPLKKYRNWIDGDEQLAQSLLRAGARGVRGIILPMYFVPVNNTTAFAGHKLSSQVEAALVGYSSVLRRESKNDVWNVRYVAQKARAVVANIDRLILLTNPDNDILCRQGSVDNIVDPDGILRHEYIFTEYPVDLQKREQEIRDFKKNFALGSKLVKPTLGNFYLPLSVQAYMAYVGWTENDVILDWHGKLKFSRMALKKSNDDGFGDDFPPEEGALKWEKLAPLPTPKSLTVPLTKAGQFPLFFYGGASDKKKTGEDPGDPYPFVYYSAVDVLHKVPAIKGVFKDKIVLIGNTDIGHADFKPCPFGDQFPGVEKHATLTANLLRRDLIRDADDLGYKNYWVIALTCLFVALVMPRIHVGLAVALSAAMISGHIYYCYYQFTHNFIWYNIVHPTLADAVLTLMILMLRVISEQTAGKHVKQVFRNFVDPAVVDDILAQGAKIELGGKSQEVTLFFSDIASFTTISEQLEPEPLFNQLNEYLTAVTDILLEHGALIDKYIGDAVMAGFGVPLASETSAEDGCAAALRAQAKINELGEKFVSEGKPPFPTRIGLNTGVVHAGMLGSSLRMAYTMIGDEVNLASRIEGINKAYKTNIAIGENTFKKLDNSFLCKKMDLVRVKGKLEPVAIYELIGYEKFGIKEDDRKRATAFEAALALYFKADFAAAKNAFARVYKEFPHEDTAQVYIERCSNLLIEPPVKDWNGVYTMTTK